MFDIEDYREIWSTIRKNRLRTFLTGFAVSWGIFMFCILLCAGNGLRNGMMSNFQGQSTNSINIWGRQTSAPYRGLPADRPVRFDTKDFELLERLPETDNISPTTQTSVRASYGTFNLDCQLVGVTPVYRLTNHIEITSERGRFLNEIDMRECRRVAVINQRMREVLFQDADPTGQVFIANGLSYTVIGIFKERSWGNNAKAYIPFTTAQLLYNSGWGIEELSFSLKGLDTEEANRAFEASLVRKLGGLHHFDPDDHRAIGIWNRLEDYLQSVGIFNGLSAFIWIIGVGTLIAGIIGVSNIMLITVRERTREIGIRKALGAKPASIIRSILIESVLITSVFGYIGMFMGIGVGELVNAILSAPGMGDQVSMIFKDPVIEVHVALGAMLVLIVSGIAAGYFPALKAVRVSPIEAMRAE